MTTSKPVTVTVAGEAENPYVGLTVYAFDGSTYSGYSAVTDAGGKVVFTLPLGSYRFRADFDGVPFWSETENTCVLPTCTADKVTLPGGTGMQEVSIDYTYDALNRLTSATYSNGTKFAYTYDAASNVLTYTATHYGLTTTTTYTYDEANQLLTADDGTTDWSYTYDSNGSLRQSDPGTSAANGSALYTYNTAGYLVKLEKHNGIEWQIQSKMKYDGLGNRLEMITYVDGIEGTTRYVLENGNQLSTVIDGSSVLYLYGNEVVGTYNGLWSYILPDGYGSPRQFNSEDGSISLSVSYSPWGDTLEIYGSGDMYLGYLGEVYDAGTGLIYMGNGVYYDPETGRFINHIGNTEQSILNSALSSDPTAMLIAPMTLLLLLFRRRKTRNKFENILMILFMTISLIACMTMVSEIVTSVVYAENGNPPNPWNSPPNIFLPNNSPLKPVLPNNTNRVSYKEACDSCSKSVLNVYPHTIIYANSSTLNGYMFSSCVQPLWDLPLEPDSQFTRRHTYPYIVNGAYTPTASGMKELYEEYSRQVDGMTFEEFVGLMVYREMSSGTLLNRKAYDLNGERVDVGDLMIQASVAQLWGSYSLDVMGIQYCHNGPSYCVNGVYKWLAMFTESAMMQYGSIIYDPRIKAEPEKYGHVEWTDLINDGTLGRYNELARVNARYIGYQILNNQSYREFSDQTPYNWGNPPAGDTWWYEILLINGYKNGPNMENIHFLSNSFAVFSIEQGHYWCNKALLSDDISVKGTCNYKLGTASSIN